MDEIKPRLRVNFKTTSKGVLSPDITAEASDSVTVKQKLQEGIQLLKEITVEEGFEWPVVTPEKPKEPEVKF